MVFFQKIKEYKTDIISLILLLIIFCCYTVVFWAHQGHPIIDNGREAYIPLEILKGKVLYKDILNLFGPFSYQFNALLYAVFGKSLNTLYIAGLGNSLIILLSVYLLAQSITSRLTSWVITFIIMVTCVFTPSIMSFVFPYTYAISYALSAFLLSLLFCVYYLKYSKPIFMLLSFLFMGISLLSKFEYGIFIPVLLFIGTFYKPLKPKYLLISFISFTIIPVICFLFLFFQGLTIHEYIHHLKFMDKYFSTPAFKYFYTNTAHFFFSLKALSDNAFTFIIAITFFSLSLLILYPALKFIFNIPKKKYFIRFSKLIQIFLITVLILLFPKDLISINATDISLSWIPISTTIILIFLCYKFVKNPENHTLKDKIFILITIAGFSASVKSFFFSNLQIFGTFILPLTLLPNIIFIVDYLPKYDKSIDQNIWKYSCLVIFILTSLFLSLNYINKAIFEQAYPLITQRGTIYVKKTYQEALNPAINYINKNISKNSRFLMVPEGPLLNFFTDRDSNNKYYNLIPHFIETFGEDNIINDLAKNPPDYIFINNKQSKDYGLGSFGKNYAFKVNKFILQNYKFQKEFGSDFKIKIYKKKIALE